MRIAKGYTESKMSRTPRGDEILELVKDGVINEMSIAYEVPSNMRMIRQRVCAISRN